MAEDKKLSYKCDFCDKSFFVEQLLGLHIKSIHLSMIKGKKKCDLCDKLFSCEKSLQKHKDTIHKEGKYFRCTICDKELASEQDLKKHVSDTHNQNSFSIVSHVKKSSFKRVI